jgi:hypothetical protein
VAHLALAVPYTQDSYYSVATAAGFKPLPTPLLLGHHSLACNAIRASLHVYLHRAHKDMQMVYRCCLHCQYSPSPVQCCLVCMCGHLPHCIRWPAGWRVGSCGCAAAGQWLLDSLKRTCSHNSTGLSPHDTPSVPTVGEACIRVSNKAQPRRGGLSTLTSVSKCVLGASPPQPCIPVPRTNVVNSLTASSCPVCLS